MTSKRQKKLSDFNPSSLRVILHIFQEPLLSASPKKKECSHQDQDQYCDHISSSQGKSVYFHYAHGTQFKCDHTVTALVSSLGQSWVITLTKSGQTGIGACMAHT